MILYIIIATLVLVIYVFCIRQSRTRVPPGMKVIPIEKGLPIIGILKDMKGSLCDYLTELSKKRGPIYRIKFGMRDVVVLNNFEYMKAALVANGDVFSGRWQLYQYIVCNKNLGVLHTDGYHWAQQRSYVLKTLKEFGIGRSRSVEVVQDECVYLLKNLEESNSKEIDFSTLISIYTANVISKFIMNRRFTHEDSEMRILEDLMKGFAETKDTLLNLCFMLPFLERNTWLMKLLVWITSRKSVFSESHGIFEKEIKDRSKIRDVNFNGQDLFDSFLTKQYQMKETNGAVGFFTDWQLIITSFELLVAGYDTTSSTLTWGFLFMAIHPDIQKKVHEEIFDKIGNERLPTMSDKTSLTYTQAVMDEILRLGSAVPLGLFHRTLNNTSVNGYFIPKNSLVIPNLLACHLDPTVWEIPLEFYPEHFLSTDEKGDVKYRPREELIPFSIGKRQCLGESLARTEYFIFFTAIIQRFQVCLSEKFTRNSILDPFRSSDGVIRQPHYKDFIFKKRN